MKFWIYSAAGCCFLVAGILDLAAREYKAGVIAIGFGILNGLIFLWR